MEMLTLFRPEVEKGELTISEEEISLPRRPVGRVFRDVPAHILRSFLSGFVKFDGFRKHNTHKVPRTVLFNNLSADFDPLLLSSVIWGHLEHVLIELDGARVRDIRKNLVEYASRFGEDALHLALLVHRRPGVRKLVESLAEAAEEARRIAAEEEARTRAEEEARAEAEARAKAEARGEKKSEAMTALATEEDAALQKAVPKPAAGVEPPATTAAKSAGAADSTKDAATAGADSMTGGSGPGPEDDLMAPGSERRPLADSTAPEAVPAADVLSDAEAASVDSTGEADAGRGVPTSDSTQRTDSTPAIEPAPATDSTVTIESAPVGDSTVTTESAPATDSTPAGDEPGSADFTPAAATAEADRAGAFPGNGAPSNGADHSNCQRTISRLEKEIEQRENLIQNERRRNGKLSQEVGQLREAMQQRDKELADLQVKFDRQQAKLLAYEQQAAQFARLDEWEARLKARDAALNNMFGDSQQALRDELLQASMRTHDLEAKHALLTMALAEARERRRGALAKAPSTEEIPLRVCIDAVRDYIEGCGRKAAEAATNGDLDLTERAEAAEALQQHLSAVSHLAGLQPGDEAVSLGDRSTAMNEVAAELEAAEVVELSLTGTVFYEGPQAWLRTEEHSLGLPGEFTDEEQLVSGDEVRLHFVHSPEDPFEWYAELVRKVDRHEVNDSLRVDEGGFWVQNPEGARLDVSLVEMIRSGIKPDSPVQVQAPAVPLGSPEPVYVRLAKALPMPNVRRPVISTGRRARRRLERMERLTQLTHGAAGADGTSGIDGAPGPEVFSKVLRGQNLLIVGGDGLESDFIDIAERLGAQVTWQSGFSEFARVSDRASKADTIILVTGRTSHAAANGAAAQARRSNKDIAHFNGLGRSSFLRFLLDTFGDGLEEAAG